MITKQHAVEARAEQCSKFDNSSFNGYFFTWVPYLGGENKTLTVFFFKLCLKIHPTRGK